MLISAGTWICVYFVFSFVMGLGARCKTRKGIDVTGFQMIQKMKIENMNGRHDGVEAGTSGKYFSVALEMFVENVEFI